MGEILEDWVDFETEEFTYQIVEESIMECRKEESSIIVKHEAEKGFYDQVLFQTMFETLLEGFAVEE
jgi:hypothetical protein